MKKLAELSKEELKKLYKNNERFGNAILEQVYSDNMWQQGEEYNLLGASVFDYSDHYSSFYLSTPYVYGAKAPEKVAGKLDADYMSEDNAKLYEKLCDKMDAWENMTEEEQETEQGEATYNEACDLCDLLADGLTQQLRQYENVTEEEIDLELERIIEGESTFSDCETDGEKVYQTITKVYA